MAVPECPALRTEGKVDGWKAGQMETGLATALIKQRETVCLRVLQCLPLSILGDTPPGRAAPPTQTALLLLVFKILAVVLS